jgi:hypothetical protein
MHRLFLAHTMHPRYCLSVHLWVPVRVVQNHGVRALQIDPKAARTRRHQEDEELRVRRIECVDIEGALHPAGATVKSDPLMLPPLAVGLKQVKHLREMREEHDSVALRLSKERR